MFEMFSKKNQVLVTPDEDKVLLHGARDLRNFQEIDPLHVEQKYGWKAVPVFESNSKLY